MLTLGRNRCGNWESAVGHEWLVTNGLGGYACGTIALANTRRYHAFLTASLNPPVERTLLVAKIDVIASYRGGIYPLSANEFAGGAIDPRGFIHIESFAVPDGIPTWHFAFADALIEQRIFMAPNANVSYLTLALKRGAGPVRIEFKPLERGEHLPVRCDRRRRRRRPRCERAPQSTAPCRTRRCAPWSIAVRGSC